MLNEDRLYQVGSFDDNFNMVFVMVSFPYNILNLESL